MSPRTTSTGAVLEAMILPALKHGGYSAIPQQMVGARPGGRPHKVDLIVRPSDSTEVLPILVSLKWQQTGGTAEQKVPFEVMCLADIVRQGTARRAYLVLGGDGWTLRDYFTSGALKDHLMHSAHVEIVTLEAFIRLANTSAL